ncbi:MAG: 3-deoxy-D-manno-octulosonic acid transferase [Cyclobacteriaceae bacterium]
MINLLYHITLFLAKRFLGFLSIFNSKQKKWINGQKGLLTNIQNTLNSSDQIIWIHAASLGEYEQARPLITQLQEQVPEYKILLTIFSPSGYEQAVKHKSTNYLFYLPLDTKKNVRQFIQIVNPTLAIFVKYEFWRNYCFELRDRNIPLLSISTRIHKGQPFFKWYSKPFVEVLKCFTYFFTQDAQSADLLMRLSFLNVTYAGDTRYDRVIELAKYKKEIPQVKTFKGEERLLVLGSSWKEDIEVFLAFFKNIPKGWKVIIAPHEVENNAVENLQKQLPIKSGRWTLNEFNEPILILDTIGLLASLYQYADLAYIGGAFKTGLHNIFEPATYGVPMIFGPNYQKFSEAYDMLDAEAGFTISSSEELKSLLQKLMTNTTYREETGKRAAYLIQQNKGATSLIMDHCLSYLNGR